MSWYFGKDNSREPVELRRDGTVVRSDHVALPDGELYGAVMRQGSVIPAEPGWYAAVRWEEGATVDRVPIIAWEACNDGDAYVVMRVLGCDNRGQYTSFVSRLGAAVDQVDVELDGIYHPTHSPEK